MTVIVPASSLSSILPAGLIRTMLSAHWLPTILSVEMSTILIFSGMTMWVVTSSFTKMVFFCLLASKMYASSGRTVWIYLTLAVSGRISLYCFWACAPVAVSASTATAIIHLFIDTMFVYWFILLFVYCIPPFHE